MRSVMVVLVVSSFLGIAAGAARADTPQTAAQLAKARVAAAAKVYAATSAAMQGGRGSVDRAYVWSVRWLDAERDQGLRGKALAHALHDHTERMKALAAAVAKRVNTGMAPASDALATDYYVVEAQLWEARQHHHLPGTRTAPKTPRPTCAFRSKRPIIRSRRPGRPALRWARRGG